MRRRVICSGLIVVLVGAAGSGSAVWAASAIAPVLSTPPQINFGDVNDDSGGLLWRYFKTSAGRPLYTFDANEPGKPTCVDACAKDFSPYLAVGMVKAEEDDWSLIAIGPNQRQWAYKGHPLYTFNGTDPSPKTFIYYADADKAHVFDPGLLDPTNDQFSPKKGWRRAEFTFHESVPTPSGVELKSMEFANGYGFADPTTGLPLYVMTTGPKDPDAWTPEYAQDLANPVGDFTIVVREDGSSQWAYKGQPLYSYKGDYSPDDMNGTFVQSDARIALAYGNFIPASIGIKKFPLRGPILVTSKGMTVYALSVGKGGYGRGRGGSTGPSELSNGDAIRAAELHACAADCLKDWTPVLAGPNDQPSGFWQIWVRPDGSRQWAYRNAALYTFRGDKKPGDMEGEGQRKVLYGKADGSDYAVMTLAGGNRGPDLRNNAGAGFFWHTVGFSD
jgi:predicted lipoprotein with Yx(FWY)xxD motif